MTFWLLSLGKMEIRLRTKIQFWRLAKKEEEMDDAKTLAQKRERLAQKVRGRVRIGRGARD